MAKDYHEKEFDDEVYEDGFYEDEEELEDDDKEAGHGLSDEDEDDDDDDDDDDVVEEELKVHVSFACEDCDYRWEDIVVKAKGSLEGEDYEPEGICPMCGSMNITQI